MKMKAMKLLLLVHSFYYVSGIITGGSSELIIANRTICGYQLTQGGAGELTYPGEFPWIVLLRYQDKIGRDVGFKCTGTIISRQYILTAASCVSGLIEKEFTLTSVRLGEWDILSYVDCTIVFPWYKCAYAVNDINVIKNISHPYHQSITGNNDIALLKLERKIIYNDYVRPICISSEDGEPNQYSVAGWGLVNYFAPFYNIKLKDQVSAVPQQQCKSMLRTKIVDFTYNMLCAKGEQNFCKGDPGGPLMLRNHKYQWFQSGILAKSFGCGSTETPIIYTRVSRYYKWILNNIIKYGY